MTADPDLSAWIVRSGLAGVGAQAIVDGLGARLLAAGLPLARINVIVDTLDPMVEGHVYRWRRQGEPLGATSYGRDYDAHSWSRSTFFHLTSRSLRSLRRRLTAENEAEFTVLAELRAEGMTDYLAVVDQFGPEGAVGEMDCVYSSWVSDGAAGFSDADLASIDRLTPLLALAIKSATLAGIAGTLAQTYLGRDAGRRVMGGRIVRGVADRIDAVLWFSDLRGYTRISDTIAADEVIHFLNDYAGPAVTAIHEAGGDVLKFMGDGLLALFVAETGAQACEAALTAAAAAHRGTEAVTARRRAAGQPATELYLGLHAGPVYYGNIGSADRLDFTVVGPAVNEASRIVAMCRSVDRPILLSSAFVDMVDPQRRRFPSVGRYALRGVARAQELFTVES